jgi:hypothetical protein
LEGAHRLLRFFYGILRARPENRGKARQRKNIFFILTPMPESFHGYLKKMPTAACRKPPKTIRSQIVHIERGEFLNLLQKSRGKFQK